LIGHSGQTPDFESAVALALCAGGVGAVRKVLMMSPARAAPDAGDWSIGLLSWPALRSTRAYSNCTAAIDVSLRGALGETKGWQIHVLTI